MSYESWIDGYVKPKQSLDKLLEALKEYGFEEDSMGYLDRHDGSSGTFVDREDQQIVGVSQRDGNSTAGRFGEFVEALQEISK